MTRTDANSFRHRKLEGAAALEFALVLPLLVILLFGIIDFGYLMFIVGTMNTAAREGARRGAVESNASNVEAAASTAANRYLSAAGLGPGQCGANCPSVSAQYAPAAAGGQADVTVTVTLAQVRGISGFTYRVLPGLSDPFARMNGITAVSQMRWELTP